MPSGYICFIFPPFILTIIVIVWSSNLQFLLSSSRTGSLQNPRLLIQTSQTSLGAGSRVPETLSLSLRREELSFHCHPSLFFPGLDLASFMKTQREMGLLRVLLGKSYFVFLMTFFFFLLQLLKREVITNSKQCLKHSIPC